MLKVMGFVVAALSTLPAFATTYEAKVEEPGTIIVIAHATKNEKCGATAHFKYSDPKEPEKRAEGALACGFRDLKAGETLELCRQTFPIINVEFPTPVTAICK